MKARNDKKLTVVLFCGFLIVMSVLYLLLPKREFSVLEKRYLAEAPKVTVERVLEGDFSEDVADYMADHMPFRDFFVGLNAYWELYMGQQCVKEVLIADDNRLVEAPVTWNETAMARNMKAVNQFAETVERVDFMLIPSGGWAAENQIRGRHDSYADERIIADVYAMTETAVNCIEVTDSFAGREELFYKTDHHWNSFGAWTGYAAYMQAIGVPYRDEAFFVTETVEGFQGSLYSRSGLWLTAEEPLELWHGSEGVIVTNGESDAVHEGVFYRERLEEADKYTVNLDGNHSVVRIENPNALTDDTLLVVRDSYSNSLGTFLAESYKTVILVDLRYFRSVPVSELAARENVDRVLICYSIGNFMTDTNVVRLR